ncbi:MAG TPA: PIN domain-containing protein [Terracidiphilus sp.]|nr:PIN domain-containing protein [Terracidiphilus sp.]
MSAPPFSDTNVVLYAFTPSGDKTLTAERILLQGGVISVQVLNELTSVACTKFKMSWAEVKRVVLSTTMLCPNPRALTYETYLDAQRISERYGFSIWDGLIIASALDAGCTTLYTEDLQHGQVVKGLRIENPFLPPRAP